jgi:hypothetical protein
MIDVNKITSTLAKLPDQQLQQYAQMHKSDPYIMALAMSESNRRKEMRAAGQGGQGMQEQPKVVDRMVAEMAPQQLPEDQGIGQLPAGEMNFAGGGIIAFADGGDVERYSGEFGSFVDGIDPLTGTFYMPDAPPDPASMRRVRTSPYVAPQQTAEEAALLQRFPKQTTKPKPDTAPPAGNRPTVPRAGPSAGPAAPIAAPTQTAAQRYADMQKGLEPDRANMDKGIAALSTSMRNTAKGELEDFEKDVAERGVAFKGREERLAKREEGLSKRKDENMGLSLLEAGLSIMSTPGSLAAAIGKGAQVGLKTYGTGLKDLRAAQEKMDDARDQIEEFRRNEANMTAKERRQFKSAINRTETDIEKLSLSAAEKMYGYKREDAKTVFTADTQERLTGMEIGSRERIANMQERGANARAAMPTGADRTAMLLGTGKTDAERLESGMKKMQEITADKSGMAAVKVLADINAKLPPGEQRVTMQDLLIGAREFSSLMYGPKVADVAPTRDRPR